VKHESHLIRLFELFVPDTQPSAAYFIVLPSYFLLPRILFESAEESVSKCPACL